VIRERLVFTPGVRDAIAAGGAIVALESTLISHGLPYPQNLEVARASEAAVREGGATPATVAIQSGRILIGLSDDHLEALATAEPGSVMKAARPSLAAALSRDGWGATTVSATMIAANAAGIRVMATGGIGGVHRGAIGGPSPTFDISSDLEELARTPVAVVCAGPKAILDVAATLEYLETRGVPVVTIGQSDVPGFFARSSGLLSPIVARDLTHAALISGSQLNFVLGGVLVCVPIPAAAALPDDVARRAVERAAADAAAAGIIGPAVTPWLLARIAELTDGASVRANTALIEHNARVAGQLAVVLKPLTTQA
jgi:pseudouridine-5'-phosphate glycosidase